MAQITYDNKVALYENTDIADINKVKADDMNEIKASVNNNDDMLNGNAVAGSMVVDGIRTKNMFDKNNITEKLSYTNTGGTTTLTDTFVQYTYIPVKPNTEYIFSMGQPYTTTNNRLTICEYDSSKTFIQRNIITPSLDPSGTGEKLVITTTSSTAYVRLCSIMAALDDLQFEEGNTRTTYTPFQNLNPEVKFLYQQNTAISDGTTITLNDSVSNYSFIEIYYSPENTTAQFMSKIDVATSTITYLSGMRYLSSLSYASPFVIYLSFSGNTLTVGRMVAFNINTSSFAITSGSLNARIFAIVGYK